MQRKTGAVNSRSERLLQIARTAASLFYKKGYLQTSTREIAEACGISKGNLYHYIRSKDDFLDLFVEMTTGLFDAFGKQIRCDLRNTSPTLLLKRAVRETILLADELQDMILFWYHESKNMGQEHLNKLINQEMHTIDLYRVILERGIEQGEFAVDDPVLAAFDIMLLCDVWALKRWYMRKHYTLDRYVEKCQNIALSIALGAGKRSTAQSVLQGGKKR